MANDRYSLNEDSEIFIGDKESKVSFADVN